MSISKKLFYCLFTQILCLVGHGEAQKTRPSTITIYDSNEVPHLMLEPLPWPSSLDLPDLQEELEREDFAACETKLLGVLSQVGSGSKAEAAVYNALGSFAMAQADISSSEAEELLHIHRAANYFSKGDSIASYRPIELRIHRAHLIHNGADTLHRLGKVQEALLKTEELLHGFEGVGTGRMKDALVARALQKVAMLRRALGHDNQSVASFLDSHTDHTSELVALVAKREFLRTQLHTGDIDHAQTRLDQMKSEYAGRDSVGHLSVVSIIQLFDGMIESISETGKAATPTHEH